MTFFNLKPLTFSPPLTRIRRKSKMAPIMGQPNSVIATFDYLDGTKRFTVHTHPYDDSRVSNILSNPHKHVNEHDIVTISPDLLNPAIGLSVFASTIAQVVVENHPEAINGIAINFGFKGRRIEF